MWLVWCLLWACGRAVQERCSGFLAGWGTWTGVERRSEGGEVGRRRVAERGHIWYWPRASSLSDVSPSLPQWHCWLVLFQFQQRVEHEHRRRGARHDGVLELEWGSCSNPHVTGRGGSLACTALLLGDGAGRRARAAWAGELAAVD